MDFLTKEKKKFFGIYLGLASTIMSKFKSNKKIGSFNLYYDKIKNLKYLDNTLENLELEDTKWKVELLTPCTNFFSGSMNDILLLKVSNETEKYLYIYSSPGNPFTNVYNDIFSYLKAEARHSPDLIARKLPHLIDFYNTLVQNISEYKNIVFCGHSNSMSASLYLSYLLSVIVALSNPTEPFYKYRISIENNGMKKPIQIDNFSFVYGFLDDIEKLFEE